MMEEILNRILIAVENIDSELSYLTSKIREEDEIDDLGDEKTWIL